MGVEGLYSSLDKRGLGPKPADIPTYLATNSIRRIHLDLLGSFGYEVVQRVLKCRRTNGSVFQTGVILGREIHELFGTSNIIIHIDGRQCEEKKKARDQREATRNKEYASLDQILSTMQTFSNRGTWTPQKVMRKINAGLKKVYQLSIDDKVEIGAGLSEAGFGICRCSTEADVCIGHTLNIGQQDIIAISGDSDLLIYDSISTVIRPIPKMRRVFAIYEKQDVLQTLGLATSKHLLLLGIVSNNDYNANAPGLGPVKNLQLLLSVQESEAIETMLDQYVAAATAITKRGPSPQAKDYDLGVRVFAYGQQTPINIPESNLFRTAIDKLEQAKAKRHEVIQSRRAEQGQR